MMPPGTPTPVSRGLNRGASSRSATEESAVLRTDRLSLHYGAIKALSEISLSFDARSITAIIGPSGSGKSSLLTCMNRLCDLVPGTRVDGRVFYQDLDIYSVDVDPLGLRRRIGMIFQKPNPFPLSIRANLELPLKEHGFRDSEERGALMETSLREAGLWNEVKDRLRSPATSLSGGQQQRLCIARAIALKPHVLLMDEPCSALDPISGGAVEQLIEKLGERYTVVLVTHHLAQARRLSSHTAMLWPEAGAGRLIEFGPTARLFSDPQHPTTAAYLEGREG